MAENQKESEKTSPAQIGLFVLAILYTLKAAEEFLVPVFLAVFLHFILRPVFRALTRLKLPRILAASLILVVVVAVAGTAFINLKDPAAELIETVPESLRKMDAEIRRLHKSNTIEKTLHEVEVITKKADGKPVQQVEIKKESVGKKLLNWTAKTAVSTALVFGLLFFLLLGWDPLVKKIGLLSEKKGRQESTKVESILRDTERVVSVYFFNSALINAGVGISAAIALAFLGMPNPALWGVLGGVLNFIPYVGAFIMICTLAAVSFLQFPFHHAIVIPFTYWCITSFESMFFTPMILGKNLTIHPFFLFLTLSFWGWLWGVAGMFIAVPALMVFRIYCQHTRSLAPLGEFLEG